MNVFLTPVMHPATATDYTIVERSLRRTHQSLTAQTDQDFLWVIVCNTIPDLGPLPGNIVFHTVDFPPADQTRMKEKMADKGAKLISGLLFVRRFAPAYLYFLDADDWLHCELNGFLNRRLPPTAGWYVDTGYLADIDTGRTQKKFRLDRFCGSTFAANYAVLMRLLALPNELDETSSKATIVNAVPWAIIEHVFFSHDHDTFFRSHGLRPNRLRMSAVMWVRGTGENVWVDGASRRLTKGLQLSRRQLARFGIDDPSITSLQTNTVHDYWDYLVIAFRSFVGSFFVKNTRYGAVQPKPQRQSND